MADWPLLAVRFALYGGLGLLFGLPFFALTTRQGDALWRMFGLARIIAMLALVDIAISLLGFALLVAQMSGAALGRLDPSVAWTLLMQSALGWSLIARIAALILVLGVVLGMRASRVKSALLALCGGIAVATLAWSGHGAANTGLAGLAHLGGDIIHLLAASAWIGALVLLLALVPPRGTVSRDRLMMAHETLAGFSGTGTVIVGLLIVTGFLNGAFTVGLSGLPHLGASTYGQLLIAKLLLFAGMLVCAAFNRFRLTPDLRAALVRGDERSALSHLRRSIAVEAALALTILALVAWFGMLEPPAS